MMSDFISMRFTVRIERKVVAKCQLKKIYSIHCNVFYDEIFEDCSLSEVIEFVEDTLLLPLLQLFADS